MTGDSFYIGIFPQIQQDLFFKLDQILRKPEQDLASGLRITAAVEVRLYSSNAKPSVRSAENVGLSQSFGIDDISAINRRFSEQDAIVPVKRYVGLSVVAVGQVNAVCQVSRVAVRNRCSCVDQNAAHVIVTSLVH